MREFAIIGLGRFGAAAALELMRLGNSVIGIDLDQKLVDTFGDRISLSVCADGSDENALRELNLASCDAVLVAIGESLEANLLSVIALKALEVKEIWVKASSKQHHAIIAKLGVARIVHPEEEMGVRVAQTLNYPMVNQYMAVGCGVYIVEIEIGEKCEGWTIKDLLGKYQDEIDALMLRRSNEIFSRPNNSFALKPHDAVVLSGQIEKLRKIAPHITSL